MAKQRIFYDGKLLKDDVTMSDVAYIIVKHFIEHEDKNYEELLQIFNKDNCGVNNLILEEKDVRRKEDYYSKSSPYIKIKNSNSKEVQIGVLREWIYGINFSRFKESMKKNFLYVIEDCEDKSKKIEVNKKNTIMDMSLLDFRENILNDNEFVNRINKFRDIKGHAQITDWIMCSIYGTVKNNESNPYPNKIISSNTQSAGTTARQNVSELFLKIGHSGSNVGAITAAMQDLMNKVYEQKIVSEAIVFMRQKLIKYPEQLADLNKFVDEVLIERVGKVMIGDMTEEWNEDKNIILYGPPGTGKTYNTVIYAVAIIEKKSISDIEAETYSEVLERYRTYTKQQKIAFTTFHQSYGYEEFIEGIKPSLSEEGEDKCDSGEISYSIEPGVFKKFCEEAAKEIIKTNNSTPVRNNPTIWKLTLKGSGDNEIKKDCFENNRIRIGWNNYDELITDETIFDSESDKRILLAFQDEMQVGDIVVSLFDRATIDAIGIISGDYEYLKYEADYKRSRSVNWLTKNIQENIYELNSNHYMNRPTIHKLNRIKASEIITLAEKYTEENEVSVEENKDNYVFIIDEINRGNISKIFGELISLIEYTKRSGKAEEIKATLPYSKVEFSVPNNVYILGTMNTADRSIAILDTALRRRFKFIEMMPRIDTIAGLSVGEISIEKVLQVMNERIEVLYDREHTIGHAYFLELKKDSTLKRLAHIFKNSIIPLLQEYFYEDYSKIQLVLGDNAKSSDEYKFIKAEKVKRSVFKGNVDIEIPEKKYEINIEAFNKPESYIEIYS